METSGFVSTYGFPYRLDDLTEKGANYTIFCPFRWKSAFPPAKLHKLLREDVDADVIKVEYIDFVKEEIKMDYKEKYEMALERAKKFIEGNPLVQNLNTWIKETFPELKESEDEKIRKEMIFYFTEEIPQCSIQEHSDKMREFISWLKRQEVERTKLELKAGSSYFCYKSRWERADSETFKKGLIYMCNKDGVLDNFVIKNPEQHFIEIKDERITWLEKQGEPKSDEWSEEDEDLLFWTINNLTELKNRYGKNYGKSGKCIDWLKSLKQRIGG